MSEVASLHFFSGRYLMFYCGIDVAKLKHVVSLVDEKGQVVKAVFSDCQHPTRL
jgi:hypothetical protein